MTPEQTKELNELSPEPLYNGKDYFDNEELKMIFGLYTICEFNNGIDAPEPEGTVIYNELPPKIGAEVVLSGGKTWIVTRFEEYNSTVYVKLKQEQESEREQDANSR